MITEYERIWLVKFIYDEANGEEQPVLRWCLANADEVSIETDDTNGELEWIIFGFGDPSHDYNWNPEDGWDTDPPILAILDALNTLRALNDLVLEKEVRRQLWLRHGHTSAALRLAELSLRNAYRTAVEERDAILATALGREARITKLEAELQEGDFVLKLLQGQRDASMERAEKAERDLAHMSEQTDPDSCAGYAAEAIRVRVECGEWKVKAERYEKALRALLDDVGRQRRFESQSDAELDARAALVDALTEYKTSREAKP